MAAPLEAPKVASVTAKPRAGQAAYVGELFTRFRRPLRIYLGGLLANAADAEDVLQEAYARLLGTGELDRSDARARAYLFRVATNLALDRLRRRRTRGLEEPIETAGLASQEPTPEQIADFDQGLAIVRRALLEMDARCREVLLLRAREQLSFEEIARRLGVSKRTAERAMHQALDICQRSLKG